MRVADYIFRFFQEKGNSPVFSLTGGGAMFLNDAQAKNELLRNVFTHHEQAAAIAALSYAKATGTFGLVCVTTGCGGTNTITGLLDSWQDNTPVFFISGQCKIPDLIVSQKGKLRQNGVQEANVIDIVKSLTKFAHMVTDPKSIRAVLEEAYHLATTGRPGPVWIDVPMDVQSAEIDPDTLPAYYPPKSDDKIPSFCDLENALKQARRPLILAGNGIHLSQCAGSLQTFIQKHGIPIVSTFLGVDLIPDENPLFLGPVGIKGVRSANFAMQNCDLLLCLGTRLSIPVTGYAVKDFAPKAKVWVVDIDAEEHSKTTARVDHFVHADLREFFNQMASTHFSLEQLDPEWMTRIARWRTKWSIFTEPHRSEEGRLNIYSFLKILSERATPRSDFISDAGSAYYCSAQALQIKTGQRYITSGAQADMGFTIPACLGAAVAHPEKTIWGITGDGSFMSQMQEIFTALGYGMNIKLVVLNNNGYLSIKSTQKKFFPGNCVGTDCSNGVFIPSFEKLCQPFGIPYFAVKDEPSAILAIDTAESTKGLCLLEVLCPEFQEVIPTLSSKKDANGKLISRPMHDMYPFLTEEEIKQNLF